MLAKIPVAKDFQHTHLVHIISSDDCTLGNSVSWLSARLSFLRFIRPHGITDGRETRQLADKSSSVIWQEISISQSRSTQGSLRFDQFTHKACIFQRRKKKKRRENHISKSPLAWLLSARCTAGNLADQSPGINILLTFQSASRNWTDSEMKSCLDISSPHYIAAPWLHSQDHDQAQAEDQAFSACPTLVLVCPTEGELPLPKTTPLSSRGSPVEQPASEKLVGLC